MDTMLPCTLAGIQPEFQKRPEHHDDLQDWNLIPQKRTWVFDQEGSSDTDEETSKRIRCKGSPMKEEPIAPGHCLKFWDLFCDDKYNSNNEISPEKVAHFLQDDILQRTRAVWIKLGSEYEGAIGITYHDPQSNPFVADAEALSKRTQIRNALAQNAGGSIQNLTVPVAEETIDAYLKALDLRWYQQRSGGKAPLSQRPSLCQPVKDILGTFRRRLIIDTIKVKLDNAAPAQSNADTLAQESSPQPKYAMAIRSPRDGPFSYVEQAEDNYDPGSPTSDEDEDLPEATPVSPRYSEVWPQEQILHEDEEQDLGTMCIMHQEGELGARLQGLDPEELENLLPSELAPEITQNLGLVQGEVSMEEETVELELPLSQQEETSEVRVEHDIQLLQEAPNEELCHFMPAVLSPITPITEEDATMAFKEFLREESCSCVHTPAPSEVGIDISGSSSSEQGASPVTPPGPASEHFKVDGQTVVLNDIGLDRLRDQERRGSDSDPGFGVVPEYKGCVEEEDHIYKTL